jgi:hypothetical protein
MMRMFIWVGFITLFTFSSCGTSQSEASALTQADGQVLNPVFGTYEGAGLEMVVTNTGATLNTGCREGAVPTPITLTNDGSFNTSGTMNPELPTNPPVKTPIMLEGKYSEPDQAFNVAITFGPEGDPQNYDLVLNGPKNLDFACPR